MKYVYLLNRFALQEKTDALIRPLRQASEARGRAYELCISNTPGEWKQAVDRYREEEVVLTAIGGDGSVNLLLNEVMGGRCVLGFIPLGTGNDFDRACRETLPEGISEIDVIRINDRFFLNAACFGIDADIANDDAFIHNRLIPSRLRYHAGVLFHFLTWKKGRPLCVEWEEGRLEGNFTTVVAANGRYYGGGYKISPLSRTDDGLMDVFLVGRLGKVSMARTILSMKKAGHMQNPAVTIVRTDRLAVSSPEPISANIDGETLTANRFALELIPRGIRLDYTAALL